MFGVFGLLMMAVSGLAEPAAAQGGPAELTWGLGKVLVGVAGPLQEMG